MCWVWLLVWLLSLVRQSRHWYSSNPQRINWCDLYRPSCEIQISPWCRALIKWQIRLKMHRRVCRLTLWASLRRGAHLPKVQKTSWWVLLILPRIGGWLPYPQLLILLLEWLIRYLYIHLLHYIIRLLLEVIIRRHSILHLHRTISIRTLWKCLRIPPRSLLVSSSLIKLLGSIRELIWG